MVSCKKNFLMEALFLISVLTTFLVLVDGAIKVKKATGTHISIKDKTSLCVDFDWNEYKKYYPCTKGIENPEDCLKPEEECSPAGADNIECLSFPDAKIKTLVCYCPKSLRKSKNSDIAFGNDSWNCLQKKEDD